MGKKGKNILLASVLIVFAVFTTILFLTVNKFCPKRLDSGVFWLAFVFAVPVNLLAAVGLHLWSNHKDSSDIVQLPAIYLVIAGGAIAYLLSGIIFMYFNINKFLVPVIVELLITAAYVIVAMFMMFGTDYITETQKQTKQKVLYVRMLQADVEDCIPKATTPEVRKALTAFAEKVHYSDPMSHPSLAGIEGELSSTVTKISMALAQGDNDLATSLIATGEELLSQRNRRCIMLK